MWKVAQAVVQGRGHVLTGIPCQDKTLFITKRGACAISLADGAGSARFSHLGAECAVECICNLLVDNFECFYEQPDPDVVRHEILSAILSKLEACAKENDCELKDLASTLLCVVVYDSRYLIVHLGDGVIGYQDEECLKVASSPNNGEFCNSTIFTTSCNAEESINLLKGIIREDIKGFVLFSDGVETIMYKHSKKEITKSLSPVFDDLAQTDSSEVEQNLLETLNEIKLHTQDDCSIIVMAKSPDDDTSYEPSLDYSDEIETSEDLHRNYLPAIIVGVILLIFVAILVFV